MQINVVNDRREYLERKIALLVGEREGLSCNLDETSEKMLVLERHNREQETKVSVRVGRPERAGKTFIHMCLSIVCGETKGNGCARLT